MLTVAGILGLGTVIATTEGPSALEFSFVISEESARLIIESGTFVQSQQEQELIIGVVSSLRRANRYYSSAETIHGSVLGASVPSIFPADRWDYLIASVRVLGVFRGKLLHRPTRPVLPGSVIELADGKILTKFLNLMPDGIDLGKIKQTDINALIDLDRLLQKHLAILSISGGGKSYACSIIIEELLLRKPSQGRPAVILLDVHGEYRHFNTLNKHYKFRDTKVIRIMANKISMAFGHLTSSDLRKFFPTMSSAQSRELDRILYKLKRIGDPFSIDTVINDVTKQEMNLLVKEALLGWLNILKGLRSFGNEETPDLEKTIKSGTLIIFDFSDLTNLWVKQILVYYILNRLFDLRRRRLIPPLVSFLEEAHQFAPEKESSPAKSIIHTIAREGRKFLCSLVLISQRPVNLSTTALSQCNSHLILRILNPNDLAWISKSSEGINHETLQMITTLGVGEGILVGEAVNYPVFIQIRKKLLEAEFDGTSLTQESKKFENIQLLNAAE